MPVRHVPAPSLKTHRPGLVELERLACEIREKGIMGSVELIWPMPIKHESEGAGFYGCWVSYGAGMTLDRDAAIALLTGGPEGVAEWNRRREDGEEIPDLRGAKLSGADLNGADLSGADLSDAILSGANLDRANLSGADLRNADLNEAALMNVDLQGAHLQEADLRKASLRAAKSLLSASLAGANITNCNLPDDVKTFDSQLSVIKEACGNARKIFLAMLLAAAYTILTIASTSDLALLTNSTSDSLPIIGAEMPIRSYFLVAPVVLLSFYFYFHFCMQGIWSRVARLPAVLPDGRRLDEALDPWLVLGLVQSHIRLLRTERITFRRGQNALAILLAWWVAPLAIALTAVDYMAIHHWPGSLLHIACWTVTVSFGIDAYMTARRTLRGAGLAREPQSLKDRLDQRLVPRTVLVVFSASIGLGGSLFAIDYQGVTADLAEADLHGANLFLADLRGANLYKARLNGAELGWANLSFADLRSTDLSLADLAKASLAEANLGFADLSGANLLGADLRGAKGLTQAQLDSAWARAPPKLDKGLAPPPYLR